MTGPGFQGFPPEAIQFLADLAANNDRAWFEPRKRDYERLLKAPMEAFCLALADGFAARGLPLEADPKRSSFRIYRDVRFSRDKSPYKTHLGASFPWTAGPGGPGRVPGAGGYFHFEPGEMYLGGGMWMPEKPRLEALRRTILEPPDVVRAAIEAPGFVAEFGGAHPHEALKRIPPGYPAEHPLADLFRWKDLVFGRRLSDAEVSAADLPGRMADAFLAAVPVFEFLAAL